MSIIVCTDGGSKLVYWCGYGNGTHGQGWTLRHDEATRYDESGVHMVAESVRQWSGFDVEVRPDGDAGAWDGPTEA